MRIAKLFAVASAVMLVAPWLSTSQAGICNLCGLCKSKCDPCKTTSCAPCEKTTACAPCAPKPVKCCKKVKECYTVNEKHWKLVKECVPVCKTRHECVADPCDPCKTKRVHVQYTDYKTKYRWVCETRPKTCYRTVKVCNEVMPAAAPCAPCGQPQNIAPAPAAEQTQS